MYGEIIAILANLSFVCSNILFRKTEHEASSSYINFFRTGIGTITFFLVGIVLGLFRLIFLLPFYLWLILILSFVFGQVIGDTAYFSAQKELGTTKTLAIALTFPFFTFLLSVIFLGEIISLKMLISAVFICVGVYIIAKTKIRTHSQKEYKEESDLTPDQTIFEQIEIKSQLKSILFAIVASFSWAIGLVLIDLGTNEIDRLLSLNFGSSIVGNIVRFPFALLILFGMVTREKFQKKTKSINNEMKRSKSTYFWLIIASLLGTSLGAYFYTEAARTAGGSFMSLMSTANPLFSLPLAYLINKEKITKLGFAGVIITIIGVIIVII